jgi:hypothetical protein
MRRRALLIFYGAALLSMFAGIAPASGTLCIPPDEAVARAMKSSSATFFTGRAVKVRSVSESRSSEVTFDVELLWYAAHPNDYPAWRVVERGQKHPEYPTFELTVSGTASGNAELVSGRRYHVIFENQATNECSVFGAKQHQHLTDALTPVDAYGDFVSQAPPAPSGPADNSEVQAEWQRRSVAGALILGVFTLVAFVVARRIRSSRHPGLGAVIGLDVGAVLAWWSIIWPDLRSDSDFYEILTPLIFMGLPLLILGTALGTLVGTFIRTGGKDSEEQHPGQPRRAIVASVYAVLIAFSVGPLVSGFGPSAVWALLGLAIPLAFTGVAAFTQGRLRLAILGVGLACGAVLVGTGFVNT